MYSGTDFVRETGGELEIEATGACLMRSELAGRELGLASPDIDFRFEMCEQVSEYFDRSCVTTLDHSHGCLRFLTGSRDLISCDVSKNRIKMDYVVKELTQQEQAVISDQSLLSGRNVDISSLLISWLSEGDNLASSRSTRVAIFHC